MTEAPATGTNFYVMHIGGTTQSSTVLPGGSSVPGDFDVSGKLGIGTSAHYDSSTKLTADGRINTSNGTATGSINYGGGSVVNMGSLTNHPVQLMVNNSTKLQITTDGRGLSQFTAKAWVNYRGITTNAIRDSHNVSSVTDNNAGRYTINFENAMANANYVPTTGNIAYQINQGDNRFVQVVNSISTTSLGISNTMVQNGFNYTDAEYVFITIFGD